MNVVVHDNASPQNEASTTFTFIRDMTPIETPVMRAWVNKGAPSSCGEGAEDSVVLDAAPTDDDDPSNP